MDKALNYILKEMKAIEKAAYPTYEMRLRLKWMEEILEKVYEFNRGLKDAG